MTWGSGGGPLGPQVGVKLLILAGFYRHNWTSIPLWWKPKLFCFLIDLWTMSHVPCKMAKPNVSVGPGGPEAASNCWYFVGFKGIIANCHGHVSGDLFCSFVHTFPDNFLEKWKKTRFTAQPPRKAMFEFGLGGPGLASKCWYFVGFKGIIATWHGHVFGDLFLVFSYVSWKQAISLGFHSASEYVMGIWEPPWGSQVSLQAPWGGIKLLIFRWF